MIIIHDYYIPCMHAGMHASTHMHMHTQHTQHTYIHTHKHVNTHMHTHRVQVAAATLVSTRYSNILFLSRLDFGFQTISLYVLVGSTVLACSPAAAGQSIVGSSITLI